MLVEVGVTREGYCAVSPDKDRFVLMQFTGLHDKNGKEIYEGDVLQINGEEGKKYVAVIEWEPSTAKFWANDNGGSWAAIRWNQDEVIGNIYSNPELIK